MKGDKVVDILKSISKQHLFIIFRKHYWEVNQYLLIEVLYGSAGRFLSYLIQQKRSLQILEKILTIYSLFFSNQNIENARIQRCRFL